MTLVTMASAARIAGCSRANISAMSKKIPLAGFFYEQVKGQPLSVDIDSPAWEEYLLTRGFRSEIKSDSEVKPKYTELQMEALISAVFETVEADADAKTAKRIKDDVLEKITAMGL